MKTKPVGVEYYHKCREQANQLPSANRPHFWAQKMYECISQISTCGTYNLSKHIEEASFAKMGWFLACAGKDYKDEVDDEN